MCNVHIAVSIFPQDSATPPLPVSLMDCYYLEEWERLQGRWEELKRQRRSFQRERQTFTDAAIRLGHEVGQSSWFYARDVLHIRKVGVDQFNSNIVNQIRFEHVCFQRCEFEQEKASLLKTDFLSVSPVQRHSQWNRRESTALSDLRTYTHSHVCIIQH